MSVEVESQKLGHNKSKKIIVKFNWLRVEFNKGRARSVSRRATSLPSVGLRGCTTESLPWQGIDIL